MMEIQESIDVLVFFKKNFIKPCSFTWNGREIKVDHINLIHTSKNGNSVFYHFSVSSGGNFYRLQFDPSKTKWILEAVEEE